MVKNKTYPDLPVLLVDDEEPMLRSVEVTLIKGGVNNIVTCGDSREVEKLIESQAFSLALVDLSMPHVTGEELLGLISTRCPELLVVVLTANNTVDSAVSCMKKGSFDYLVKPVSRERLLTAVHHALSMRDLAQENLRLKSGYFSREVKNPDAFQSMVSGEGPMYPIFSYVEAIASSITPVLITGETGVGKELLAKSIHTASGRKGKFVAVNVAGLDDNMFADTLFGHKKGAFTSADSSRAGIIDEAAGGSLFLDEIGDLSMASQVKLLRLLQENEYIPLGSDMAVKSDARIIVATNIDLAAMKSSGKFRPDLYFRLSTHNIRIPPLRERVRDIPLLIKHFVTKAAEGRNGPLPSVHKSVVSLLSAYSFPGNVRELESMVRDAVSRMSGKVLSAEVFTEHIIANTGALPSTGANGSAALGIDQNGNSVFGPILPSLKEAKKLLIAEALRRSDGNVTKAAELLGTSRQALSWQLKSAD